jgi:hypothetical protein
LLLFDEWKYKQWMITTVTSRLQLLPKFDDVPLIRWCPQHAVELPKQASVVDVPAIHCA